MDKELCWHRLLPAAQAARAFVELSRNRIWHFSHTQILKTQAGQRRLNLKTQEGAQDNSPQPHLVAKQPDTGGKLQKPKSHCKMCRERSKGRAE